VGAVVDLSGKRFGRLTAVSALTEMERSLLGLKPGMIHWRSRCDCGKLKIIRSGRLTSGHSKSCGCIKGTAAWRMKHSLKVKETWARRLAPKDFAFVDSCYPL